LRDRPLPPFPPWPQLLHIGDLAAAAQQQEDAEEALEARMGAVSDAAVRAAQARAQPRRVGRIRGH
jgi:hypothetical protein